MIRAIRLLVLRRVRTQPARAAMTVVTIAAGVSLAMGVLVVVLSVESSLERFGRSLAGPAPLRVVGGSTKGGIDPSVLPAIERVEGVAHAVPVVQAVTLAGAPDGDEVPIVALGVDCRADELVGGIPCGPSVAAALGDRPISAGAALIDEVGTDGFLRTDIGRVPLDRTPSSVGLDEINGGFVVVFPLETAQRVFSRSGGVDVVYLDLEDSADAGEVRSRLTAAVGSHLTVLDATEPPPEVQSVVDVFVPIFALIGLVALGTATVLVYNTMRLTLEERRRQLAILAALGATPRLVGGGAVLEAGLFGAIGGLVGSAGGILVAYPIMAAVTDVTREMGGVMLRVDPTHPLLAVGPILGALTGMVAAALPARRALRMNVALELSGRTPLEQVSRVSRWRVLVIGAASYWALSACWWAGHDGGLEPGQAAFAPVAFFAFVILTMVFGTLVTPWTARLAGPLVRRWSPARQLAVKNMERDRVRTGTTAVAVAAAVGVAFVASSFHRTVREGTTLEVARTLNGVLVTAVDPTVASVIDARIAPEAVDALGRLPGVARTEREASVVAGTAGGTLVAVVGVDRVVFTPKLLDGTGDRGRFEDGQVMVGPVFARDHGVRGGDSVRLATRDGFTEVPVQGVWQDGSFAGRAVTVPYALLEELYGPQHTTQVRVVAGPGVSPADLARQVEDAAIDPDLSVHQPGQLVAALDKEVARQVAPFKVMQRWLLGVSFVAVLSTLLLVGVQRRRELALLTAVGMTPSETAGLIVAEGALIGFAGAVGGYSFGVFGSYTFGLVLSVFTGSPYVLQLDVRAGATAAVLALLIATVASAWPAWRAAHFEVLPGLQYE